jgi:hypothetical protein
VAHAEWGVNRYFGFAVPDLLAAGESLAGLVTLAVRGWPLAPEERGLIDDIAVSMTLADPRVWPLKMARVVSSYGGCTPALAAGLLCLEGARIGPWTCGAAAELLLALRDEATQLTPAAMASPLHRRLQAGQRLPGFDVPFRSQCERLPLVQKSVAARGRDQLPAWRTLEAVIGATRELKGPEPNVGLGVAAALLDLGFTPRQVSILSTTLAQTEFLSNVAEGSEQRAAVLRRIPDDRIRYVGKPPRETPRAAASARRDRGEANGE